MNASIVGATAVALGFAGWLAGADGQMPPPRTAAEAAPKSWNSKWFFTYRHEPAT